MTEFEMVTDTRSAEASTGWLSSATEWSLWSFLAFCASVLFLIVSLILLLSVNDQQARIDQALQVLESAESLPDRESRILAEARTILQDIEAAEERALGYLGIFEALGFGITLGSIVIALVGIGIGINFARVTLKLARAESRYAALQDNIQQSARNASLSLSLLPLARRQQRSGDLDGALKTYKRAIELEENNPVPHYHRGYILTQKNDLEEAKKALEQALTHDPTLPQAQAALGYVYRRMGDDLAAIIEDQQRPADARNQARRQQADYYERAEEYILLALTRFKRLVDDDSESWYGSLAGMYKRLGNYEKAKMYYNEARTITPQSSYPEINLALVKLIHEGDIDGALTNFQRVEKLARYETRAELDNYWAQGDLLIAQLALGQPQAAIDDTLEEFRLIVPDDASDVLPRVISTLEQIRDVYAQADRDIRLFEHVLDSLRALQSEQL